MVMSLSLRIAFYDELSIMSINEQSHSSKFSSFFYGVVMINLLDLLSSADGCDKCLSCSSFQKISCRVMGHLNCSVVALPNQYLDLPHPTIQYTCTIVS